MTLTLYRLLRNLLPPVVWYFFAIRSQILFKARFLWGKACSTLSYYIGQQLQSIMTNGNEHTNFIIRQTYQQLAVYALFNFSH
jgi:hypothetical protein